MVNTSNDDTIKEISIYIIELFENTSINTIKTLSFTSPSQVNVLQLIYPKLIDWDQQQASILDILKNDDDIVEFMGVRDGIPPREYKEGFDIDLDVKAYFG